MGMLTKAEPSECAVVAEIDENVETAQVDIVMTHMCYYP